VCASCLDSLPRLAPPLCARCGAPTAWPVERCAECGGRRLAFVTARAAVAYDERMRRVVAGWKEHGLRRLAREAAQLTAEVVARPDVDALTFVPPDRKRVLERGHHPAASLARELGALWELPVPALLDRPRTSARQRGASLAERRRNVRGAFTARASPARICLVDDVYTSGATASAAASALRRAGAKEVRVVTVARALRLR
jgi:predicted amidophosphoribosyltransferase